MVADLTAEAPGRAKAKRAAKSSRAATRKAEPRARRRPTASLTARILAINVMALAILAAGILYVDQYQQDLYDAKIDSLMREGTLIAGAVGESVGRHPETNETWIDPTLAAPLMQRLSIPSDLRVRLFNAQGLLIVDSQHLPGARVQTRVLPPPSGGGVFGRFAFAAYDWIIEHLPPRTNVPPHFEPPEPRASDFPEAARALAGETGSAIRETPEGSLIAIVSMPVQPLRRIQGALLLTTGTDDVESSIRSVRFTIVEAFAIALGITVLLTLYIAGTITRPVKRLARAAERVRAGRGRKVTIPDFTSRRDEIGGLSAALRDMTEALWVRMDAIERFVADVAHEMKNPLSSVRSAVETARRVKDPAERDRLLEIVNDDVKRLNRLLSEIADSSKIDSELSRIEGEPVDLGSMMRTILEVHRATSAADSAKLDFHVHGDGPFIVTGVEDRLVQVLRNLLSNAQSFSPPGGVITLTLRREGGMVRIEVEDQGPGVDEANLEDIFERFYTFRPESETFGTHSGLGLSISRQIVEGHDGTIRCENRKDEAGRVMGARFIVRLPAAHK